MVKIHSPVREVFAKHILKATYNSKSELVLLEWTPHLCLRFVLYNMRLVNTFYHRHIWCYELFTAYAKFGTFYAKLNGR